MKVTQKIGQITLFILIALGIFLVLVVGYILYTEYFLNDASVDFVEATKPITPLQTYIEQCISLQTRDGLERLGEQGGYIDVPTTLKQNRQLAISPHPSREYIIPYWVNKDQILIPTIEGMETALANHITRTLPFCLDDFGLLGETSDITIIRDPTARVSINEDDVIVDVTFSVSKTNGGVSTTFDRFIYKEPIALRQILQTSREFALTIAQSTFLEDMTVDLMSISDPRVPMSNMRMRCDPQIWFENKIQKNLEQILYQNIPSIRVKGAEVTNFEEPESVYAELNKISVDDFADGLPYDPADIPSDTYQHAHMYYDGGQARDLYTQGVKIAARYLPEYGMEFAVRPSSNGKLETSTAGGTGDFLKFLCIQIYHFTYDVSYPIEFVVRKESAFRDGSPFILRFATSVNIDHNLPDKSPLSESRTVLTGDRTSGSDLCIGTQEATTTFLASDVNSAVDVSGVAVDFICHKYVCPLGNTTLQNGRALLNSHLPTSCYGGKVEFSKDGYISQTVSINEEVAANVQQTYQVDLTPLRDVSYKVVLGKNENSIIPTELKENQYAVILLDDVYSDFETYATFDTVESLNILTLPDYSSEYEATILVYEDDGLIGGYIGPLTISQQNLRQRLTIHTLDFISQVTDAQFSEAWTRLNEDEVYREYHQASWT